MAALGGLDARLLKAFPAKSASHGFQSEPGRRGASGYLRGCAWGLLARPYLPGYKRLVRLEQLLR